MINVDKKNPILRISDGKDPIADPTILLKYINEHDRIVANKYNALWDAYSCHAEILDRNKIRPKSLNKPDYRIAVNYPRYIVDTYNGFARGIPVKITADNPEVNDYINFVADMNELDDVNAEIHKNKCIFGESYQIVYVDEDGEIGTVPASPLEAFPIYSNSIRPKVKYFVRTYFDEDGNRHGTISDDTFIYYFDISGGVQFTDQRFHGFPDVPVVVYTMNSARIGLIEIVLPMCNAYDKAISEKMNDVDSFADAILKVLGVTLSEDDLTNLRERRIINVTGKNGSDAVVDFLSRPSGDDTQEHLLERLEKLIFTVSMVCNVSDNNFATSSGIALKMKLQPMSNLASGDWRIDQAAMKKFWRLVFGNPVNTISPDAWQDLKLTNSLNYPDDASDSADIATKLSGIVSHKTQLAILPASIVPDIDAELLQIENENEIENESEDSNAPEDETETEAETEETAE
jgi:SPP1 family phage portal protein